MAERPPLAGNTPLISGPDFTDRNGPESKGVRSLRVPSGDASRWFSLGRMVLPHYGGGIALPPPPETPGRLPRWAKRSMMVAAVAFCVCTLGMTVAWLGGGVGEGGGEVELLANSNVALHSQAEDWSKAKVTPGATQ